MAEDENLSIARLAVERWNAGDLDGVLALYADDATMHSGPEWPEQASSRGLADIRRNMEEWRDVWQSSEMEVESVERHGEGVVATGTWSTRGRVSGVDGRMPFAIVIVVRNGKIASLEWCMDRGAAIAAARET